MKIKLLVTGIYLATATLLSAATNDLSGLLQKGLFEEEANRNLDAATAAYQTLVTQFDKDRQIGATAIFRLGEVYRKQGKTNEAAAQYERIVRDFAEQTTLVTLSRQNLAGLNKHSDNPESKTSPKDLEPDLAQLKKLSRVELLQVLPTLAPDQLLTKLLEQLNTAQTKQAELRQDMGPDHPDIRRLVILEKTLSEQIDQRVTGILKALELRSFASEAGSPTATVSTVVDEEEAEIRRIQAMIQNSPDLKNAPAGEDNLTPLCRAAAKGQLRVATFLLDNGADVNRQAARPEKSAMTPLHYAVQGGHRAVVELLLAREADVNARDGWERTPLHLAAEKGFQVVAEVLVARKAAVNAQAKDGQTPLNQAVGSGQARMVSYLIANHADLNLPDSDGRTPLLRAAADGRLEVLSQLLAAGAKPDLLDGNGWTALSRAAADNTRLDVVKALLATKADPNAGKEVLPLHLAIHGGNRKIQEVLLAAGADANRVSPIIWQLAFNGNLLQRTDKLSPLSLAIVEQRGDVKLLLQHKADANGLGPDRQPVIFAVRNQPELLEALLEAGANPNVVDGEGKSPLLRAYIPEAVRLLLAHKANPEAGRNGWTPLLDAATWPADNNGGVAKAEALLKGGANVNATTPSSDTALILAAARHNTKLVELLLAYKVEVNARNTAGRTALDCAKATGDAGNEIAALLRQHGALDELPDFTRIRVTRQGLEQPISVFRASSDGRNEFTLFETVLAVYEMNSFVTIGGTGRLPRDILYFPALDRIVIHRPDRAAPGKQQEIVVNLLNGTNGIDGARNVMLKFGDVVEIPVREHSLNASSVGLTSDERSGLWVGSKRIVQLKVRGQTKEFALEPTSSYLREALGYSAAQSLLLSTSDLSRVKVTRADKSGKKRGWVLDARTKQSSQSSGRPPGMGVVSYNWGSASSDEGSDATADDLWLRDGDVIEVPDKP